MPLSLPIVPGRTRIERVRMLVDALAATLATLPGLVGEGCWLSMVRERRISGPAGPMADRPVSAAPGKPPPRLATTCRAAVECLLRGSADAELYGRVGSRPCQDAFIVASRVDRSEDDGGAAGRLRLAGPG